MYCLYFIETNGGYLTCAVNHDGRACYMHQDGHEEIYPLTMTSESWWESTDGERVQAAYDYLRILGAHMFDDLYEYCEGSPMFCGTYTKEDFQKDMENDSCLAVYEVLKEGSEDDERT